jgi:tRNA-2-methylthio-N6-dimethylallyladenosine synthase
MKWVGYEFSYMFKYSERPGTLAAKKYKDDVDEQTKSRRLQEIVDLQQELSAIRTKEMKGRTVKVLIEGLSKKSNEHLKGRNSHNVVCVFPKEDFKPGDYVEVLIENCTSATLMGKAKRITEQLV